MLYTVKKDNFASDHAQKGGDYHRTVGMPVLSSGRMGSEVIQTSVLPGTVHSTPPHRSNTTRTDSEEWYTSCAYTHLHVHKQQKQQ